MLDVARKGGIDGCDIQLLMLERLAGFHDSAEPRLEALGKTISSQDMPSDRRKFDDRTHRTIASCRCEERSVKTLSVVDLFSSTCVA